MSNSNNTTVNATSAPVLLTEREKRFVALNWADEPILKRAPLKEYLQGHDLSVGVHNGPFHADEACSIALLQLVACSLSRSARVEVVRTRDAMVLDQVDLRLDVGEGALDHHYSRARKGVCAFSRLVEALIPEAHGRLRDKHIAKRLRALAADVAGIDTGVEGTPNQFPEVRDLAMCATARSVGKPDAEAEQIHEELFWAAVDACRNRLERLQEVWEAESAALDTAQRDIEAAGPVTRYMAFSPDARMAPCKEMLYQAKAKAWYYISRESEHVWYMLCAADPSKEFSGFSSWKLIPKKFRGLHGEALTAACGVHDAIFCHKDGFIAGFETRAAAEDFAAVCVATVQAGEKEVK